jgi:hypothetical protein
MAKSTRRPAGKAAQETRSETPRIRVRLPGFIRDEEVGLGDVIKRATYSVGIRPCGGCGRRVAALNRWVMLTR